MDKDETSVIMFLKKGEFKKLAIEDGRMYQDTNFDLRFED